DKWVRRRIRACYWRQWYRVRTRIRMLLKLGVRRDEAFSHGSSGRGPWVMSSSAAVHVALSIEYLHTQGLVSLEENLDQVCFQKPNRLMWTRMSGGVGGARSNAAPIPIIVRPYAVFRV
ncbi:MAG: hypothetical protein R3C59_31695, partial [Planctomycetaceae bacterium]